VNNFFGSLLVIYAVGLLSGLLLNAYLHRRKSELLKEQLRAYRSQVTALRNLYRRLELVGRLHLGERESAMGETIRQRCAECPEQIKVA
jgi:hypothetical protein